MNADRRHLRPAQHLVVTLHRPALVDGPLLAEAMGRLTEVAEQLPVVFPVHPRTRAAIDKAGLALNLHVIEPVGYLEMIWLLQRCGLVLTDSGGVQKESFFFGKACVTMRDQTEWVELVTVGANELVGADQANIVATVCRRYGEKIEDQHRLYGGGQAAKHISHYLSSH